MKKECLYWSAITPQVVAQSKNNTIVEYSLKDINKPLGISEYKLTKLIPDDFKSSLPSIEDIEAELGGMDDE